MYCEDIFDLIDRLARADRRPVLDSFLDEFQRATGLAHVAYVAFNLPTGAAGRLPLSAVCARSWRKLHVQSRRVDLAPLLRAGLGGIAPKGWGVLDRDDPVVRKLLGETLELDVGGNGVSIPLRGRDGEYALFSACVQDSGSWGMSRHGLERALREKPGSTFSQRALMRRLMVASAIFHAKVRRAYSVRESRGDRLTDRELACLRLRALRKTDDEIGLALGASSSAARFWLETARVRLDAATVDKAVEKAMATGLIRLDHAAFGRNRPNADNVIDSKSLERALREKPVPTFSQRAPGAEPSGPPVESVRVTPAIDWREQ